MKFCKFFQDLDFFGKLPEIYIKGKPKQISLIGRIFTCIFIIIYIIIFVYKLYRMTQRVDITFYDSYSDTEENPSFGITNENFNLIFSILDDSEQPFIEETIYSPKAYFKDEVIEEIKLERCSMDKLGSKYRNFLNDIDLEKYYCLNKVNYTFSAYMNSILIQLFPCKNTTKNNNHCKPKEIIDEALNGKDLEIKFQDILLTPLDYNTPIKERINLLYTTVYKTFGQYLFTEMQLVKIETSTNIIGFDFLTNPKKQYYIKYNSLEIIPEPGYDLYYEKNNYPICEVEFQLNEKILYEKREYIQFIDVLGEVGGLMEIINSFFGLICSFFGDMLYEKKIANNLFSFDINKRIIRIKNGNKINNEFNTEKNEEVQTVNVNYNSSNYNKLTIMENTNKEIKDKHSENYMLNKNNLVNSDIKEIKQDYSSDLSHRNSLKYLNKSK